MESWEAILSPEKYENCILVKSTTPIYDEVERIECLRRCEDNLCGDYGKTWACPPGMDVDPSELYRSTSYVLIVRRTFRIDCKDAAMAKTASSEMQDAVRRIVLDLRSNSIGCIGFADGGCDYFGVCAYPDKCRFPDMLVRSVSALGLDLGKYLSESGLEFSFSDDSATLYGLIFVLNRGSIPSPMRIRRTSASGNPGNVLPCSTPACGSPPARPSNRRFR